MNVLTDDSVIIEGERAEWTVKRDLPFLIVTFAVSSVMFTCLACRATKTEFPLEYIPLIALLVPCSILTLNVVHALIVEQREELFFDSRSGRVYFSQSHPHFLCNREVVQPSFREMLFFSRCRSWTTNEVTFQLKEFDDVAKLYIEFRSGSRIGIVRGAAVDVRAIFDFANTKEDI